MSAVAVAPGGASLGKYQLFAKLGRGGMADVFLAVARGPLGFNKLAVVKRLRIASAQEDGLIDMFVDEARLAARLTHPNIVHTYEVGEQDGSYFIAMEYLEGQPLNRIARRPDSPQHVTPLMWAWIIAEALRGLHHAHELKDYDGTPLQIVHRDISPHNVFLTYSGDVKIVDFGIAKATINVTHTETGVLKGKVRYMAPEQVRGTFDRRADVFSMGVVLWEMLAGRKLFDGDAVKALHDLLNVPIPELASVQPLLDPELCEIVTRAVQREPGDRFQTAEEMADALDAHIRKNGETVRKTAVARAMSLMFHDVKESVAKQVQQYMTTGGPLSVGSMKAISIAPADGHLPEIQSASGTPSSPKPIRDEAGRIDVEWDAPSALGSDPQRATARKRKVILALAAIGALALFGVIVLLASSAKKNEPARVADPTSSSSARPGARRPVSVSLTSDPTDATVTWNGHALGRTPLRVDLPPGAQTLVVSKDGYVSDSSIVELSENDAEAVTRHVVLARQAITASMPSFQRPEPGATAPLAGGRKPWHAASPPSPPKGPSSPTAPVSSPADAPTTAAPSPPVAATAATGTSASKVRVLDDDNGAKPKVLE